MSPARSGFTLVELIIALVLIGLIATMSVAGMATTRTVRDPSMEALEQARREAAATGRGVQLLHVNGPILVLPTGTTISDSLVGLSDP